MCLIHAHSQQNARSATLHFLSLCEPFSSHVFKPFISGTDDDEEEEESEDDVEDDSFSGDGRHFAEDVVAENSRSDDDGTYSTLSLIICA